MVPSAVLLWSFTVDVMNEIIGEAARLSGDYRTGIGDVSHSEKGKYGAQEK